jgi:hypothetical protein
VNRYKVGQVIAITVTITDVLGLAGPVGAPVDPGTIVFSYQAPGAATATLSTTHVSTGVYRAFLSLTAEGPWLYKWVSTNNVSGVGQGAFDNTLYAEKQIL